MFFFSIFYRSFDIADLYLYLNAKQTAGFTILIIDIKNNLPLKTKNV